ncbi:MAG: EamA family transporter [Candidatus Nomurabacteria bacterium]|nr:EamA family transporter [Candidatus Nomurabacteria bacterium]
MFWILPISLLIVFEVIADIFAKQWSLGSNKYFWIFALTAYLIGNVFWLFALKNGSGLSRGAVIFSLSTEILAICIGLFFYHESVNKIQILGMFLGLVSLFLILWE